MTYFSAGKYQPPINQLANTSHQSISKARLAVYLNS